jgi:hypothetical protein
VCVGPTTCGPGFGTLAFSADGTTVTNPFGQNDNGSNARSSVGVDSGAYYWEIEVVEGDASINDGGVGVLRSDMGAVNSSGTNYYAYDEGGLSFGYGTGGNTIYYWNWPGATLQPITPPLRSAVNQGVVYMFALDMDNQRLWAGQDGSWHSGDPSTGQAPRSSRDSMRTVQCWRHASYGPPFEHGSAGTSWARSPTPCRRCFQLACTDLRPGRADA